MVSILPVGGDRNCVMYQRMEQAKSPLFNSHTQNYSKNLRTEGNMDSNVSSNNNIQSSTSCYLQQQNRNIQNSNAQGTRISRNHYQNSTNSTSDGILKNVHIRSASMPEAVYVKVHHHQQQTATVPPPNHFQPLELLPNNL